MSPEPCAPSASLTVERAGQQSQQAPHKPLCHLLMVAPLGRRTLQEVGRRPPSPALFTLHPSSPLESQFGEIRGFFFLSHIVTQEH